MWRLRGIGLVCALVMLGALVIAPAAFGWTETWDPITGTDTLTISSGDSLNEATPEFASNGEADACIPCDWHTGVRQLNVVASRDITVIAEGLAYAATVNGGAHVNITMIEGAHIKALEAVAGPFPESLFQGSVRVIADSSALDFNGDGTDELTISTPTVDELQLYAGASIGSVVDLRKWNVPGKVTVTGTPSNDTIYGSPTHVNTLNGGAGADKIYGGSLDDTIYGGAGSDLIFGGAGADRLFGGHGTDHIYGGPGNDAIFADEAYEPGVPQGPGDDVIDAGPGNDQVYASAGHEQIHLGAGNDTCTNFFATIWVWGGPGNDNVNNRPNHPASRAWGGSGNDTIYFATKHTYGFEHRLIR